jgi:hypothetical protein
MTVWLIARRKDPLLGHTVVLSLIAAWLVRAQRVHRHRHRCSRRLETATTLTLAGIYAA